MSDKTMQCPACGRQSCARGDWSGSPKAHFVCWDDAGHTVTLQGGRRLYMGPFRFTADGRAA